MSVKDRPKVKAECLRLLAGLKLDPARTTLVGGFIDSYLRLNAQEMKQYERAVGQFPPTEREATMEIMTSWHEAGIKEGISQGISLGKLEGLQEGLTQGKEGLILRLLRRRFGTISADITARLDTLSPEQLDDLGEALLDFDTIAELEQWFAQH